MTPERPLTLPGRCWRLLTAWLPRPAERRLKAAVKGVLRAFGRKGPNPLHPDDLGRQLDAVLRELRRLHARLEEMQEAMEALRRPEQSPATPPRRAHHGDEAA
jgi:hypothetical protein